MRVDVCIATFKRPRLLERLLADVVAQQLPDTVSMHIIVVDNDALESGRAVVASYQASGTSVEYLVQPERNIALSRNVALDHSQGELIAFIDDDESAPADWLLTLMAAMERYAADVVLGPVRGILPATAPRWIAKGRFFEPRALSSGTRVDGRSGGTGNVLMKAAAVRGNVAFDPRYGLSGSEDTDFFQRLWRKGTVLVWCQEAALTEHVPEERLTMRWLLERGFWAGQGYADIMGRPRGGVRLGAWFVGRVVLTLAAAFLSLASVPFSRTVAMRWGVKLATNFGQLSTILGYRHQPYRS